jgi:5'-3' exonuclease
MTPDKDMAQCVREDGKVVCYDRRQQKLIDADGVRTRFGVSPTSIPDFLALVGDSADGYPGIPGWGKVSAATVLTRYVHLEDIPERAAAWDLSVRNAPALAAALRDHRNEVFLFRELATLTTDVPLPEKLDELRWRGAHRAEFTAMAQRLGAPGLVDRVPLWID